MEASAPELLEVNATELLARLEDQAAESGRLAGRVQALEAALKKERDARRRLADTLRRERGAAERLHTGATHAEAMRADAAEEVERLRDALSAAEQQTQLSWAQVGLLEEELRWATRPLWRKLLRRPPAAA